MSNNLWNRYHRDKKAKRRRNKNKRWNKSIRNARWRTNKKYMLANGFVEVGENTLVPASQINDFPPYVPTHLGGKVTKSDLVKLSDHSRDLPRRSIMRQIKGQARRMGISVRQYMFGEWPD